MTSLTIALALTLIVPLALSQEAEASHPTKKVTNLTGTPSVSSVLLSWDAPTRGTTPQDYVIQYRLANQLSWTTLPDGVNTRTSVTIPNLSANTAYDFKVGSKILDNVKIKWARSIEVTTTSLGTATPPNAPTNLSVTSKTTSSVTLDWDRPRTGITPNNYGIEFKKSGGQWTGFDHSKSSRTAITVTDLESSTKYYFKVYSIKDYGNGVLGESGNTPSVYTRTTAEQLNKPTGLELIPQDTAMVLTWKTPSGLTPTGYVIEYKRADQTLWITEQSRGTGLEKTISGLYNNQQYQFKVASKAGSQTSIYTSEVSARPTDNCNQSGADRTAQRCYATQQYDFKQDRTVRGIQGIINFDDVNITSGFNQASYWLVMNGAFKIFEVGIHDASSGSPKFICALDGNKVNKTFATNPSNDVDYDFKIEKSGRYWKMYSNGELCQSVRNSQTADIMIRGTETPKNNTPDFIQEFKEMKFKRYSTWKDLSSTYGTDSRAGLAHDFFIDRCGTGSENFKHIETGKGTSRNC